MRLEDFLGYFDRVRKSGDGVTARCPAHDDRHNSLSVGSADGKILLHCHTGCSPEAVVASIGLDMAALMPEKPGELKEIRAYDYRDESGTLLFQAVRMMDAKGEKTFRQRRPDGAGGWIWNLEGVRRIPYKLPEILKLDREQKPVILIVEGEKDAERLARFKYDDGSPYIATCNPGGVGMGWLDTYSAFFRGHLVAIIPDNDEPGWAHAEKVKESLERFHVEHVVIVNLPGQGPILPKKGRDVSDWLMDDGNDKDKFDQIVYRTIYPGIDEREAIEEEYQEALDSGESDRIYWDPYSLTHAKTIRPPVGFLHTSVFPRRTVSLIMGPSSSGKSYFVMFLGETIANGQEINEIKTKQGNVLFLSLEMEGPELLQRSALVWTEETMHEWYPSRFQFRWEFSKKGETIDLGGELDNPSVDHLVKIIEEAGTDAGPVDVVFLDSLSKAHHTDENSNETMGVVMANLELVAKRANKKHGGVALIVIHHAGKPNIQNGVETRTGFHKGRGASCIPAAANDVLMVDPWKPGEDETVDPHAPPKSIITFDKTRSVPLSDRGPLQPFTFTQDNANPPRTISLSDGRTISATQFVTAKYVPPPKKLTGKNGGKKERPVDEAQVSKLADRIEEEIRKKAAMGEKLNTRQLIELVGGTTGAILTALRGLKAQGVVEGEPGPKKAILWVLKTQPKEEGK